ncbi:MAG: hypothetical protein HRU20_18895 [Pseudomonadales bacterium]|nr:hypothetical protein [Pseudomonadales bacterium]
MLQLIHSDSGYKNANFNVSVSGNTTGLGLQILFTTDIDSRVTSEKIIQQSSGYKNHESLTIVGGEAQIQLSEFGLFVTANTPFDLDSVPLTRPKIGGDKSSDKGKASIIQFSAG